MHRQIGWRELCAGALFDAFTVLEPVKQQSGQSNERACLKPCVGIALGSPKRQHKDTNPLPCFFVRKGTVPLLCPPCVSVRNTPQTSW